ncbi:MULTISPECIES: hypothetical protein [Cupriavidus]|nr:MULTISPECIES: hypothetical protein [Cupriavidus]QYY34077.1 hypothetical protein K2O51_32395 [Cupriavidus pinatubonensis]
MKYTERLARPLNVSGPESIMLKVRKTIHLLQPIEQATVEEGRSIFI